MQFQGGNWSFVNSGSNWRILQFWGKIAYLLHLHLATSCFGENDSKIRVTDSLVVPVMQKTSYYQLINTWLFSSIWGKILLKSCSIVWPFLLSNLPQISYVPIHKYAVKISMAWKTFLWMASCVYFPIDFFFHGCFLNAEFQTLECSPVIKSLKEI